MSTIDEISCGEKVFRSPRYSTSTMGLPSWSTMVKGHDSMSFLTVGSSKRRPISRLCPPSASGAARARARQT